MFITILELLKTITPSREFTEENDNLLLDIITQCINRIVVNGDQNKQTHEQFYPPNKKLPSISVRDYLHRLLKYSPCSKECFIASLYYMDKLITECGLSINSYNIHRILITTLVISTKYLDDIFYNNDYYSQVGGIQLREMNSLELDFLKLVKFGAVCPDEMFEEYRFQIEATKLRFLQKRTAPSATAAMNGVHSQSPVNSPRRLASGFPSNFRPDRRGSCDVDIRSTTQDSTYHANCAA